MNRKRLSIGLLCFVMVIGTLAALAGPLETSKALALLVAGEPPQRVEALRVLGTSGDPRVAPVLLSWAYSVEPECRLEAVRSLGKLGGILAEQALLGLARKSLRSAGALSEEAKAQLEGLALLGTPVSARFLLGLALARTDVSAFATQLLEQHHAAYWAEAKRILGSVPAASPTTGPDGDVATLLQWLYSGTTPELRMAAALALAATRDARAIPVLESMLQEGPSELKRVAMQALQKWDIPEASLALSICAENGEMSLRKGCLESLFDHHSKEATWLLVELEWQASAYFTVPMSEALRARFFEQEPDLASARYLPDGGDAAQMQVDVFALLATAGSLQRQKVALTRSIELGPDVVPLVVYMAKSGPKSLRRVAMDALAKRADASGWSAMSDLALSPVLSSEDRIDVVKIMGSQNNPEPARMLIPVASKTGDEAVRQAIRDTLKAHHPELLPKKGEEASGALAPLSDKSIPDRSGVPWLAGVGALHGAAAMGLMGADGATVLPALGGAVLGATLPLWLTMNDPRVLPEHALWTFSTGTWALAETALLATGLVDGSAPSRLALVGLGLVEASGAVFGGLTRKSLGEDSGQTLFMHSSWAMGMAAGAGWDLLAESDDPKLSSIAGMAGVGGLAGLVASGIWATDIDYSGQDAAQFAQSMALGSWTGIQLANGLELNDEAMGGLALAGLSTGYLAASILGAFEDQPLAETLYQTATAGAGVVLGQGLFELSHASKAQTSLALAGGAILGTLGGRLTAPYVSFSDGDLLATAALGGAGMWTGAWMTEMLAGEQVFAGTELGLGLGYLAATLLAANTDTSFESVGVASAAHVWGNLWGAGLGLVLTPIMNSRWVPAVMLPAGWGASALALATSDSLSESKGNVAAMTALGTFWGAWQGMGLAGGLGAESEEVLAGAAMLGVTTGGLLGGLAGHYFQADGDTAGRMATGGVLGSYLGAGFALLVPEANSEGILLASLSAGWAGLALKGLYVPPAELTFGDYLAMGAGAGWGLFQSSMIADAVGLEDERAAGARIVGTGLGLLAGEVFARATDLTTGQVLFTELASYSGSGMLTGAYLLGDQDDDVWLGALSAVGGVAGKLALAPVSDQVAFRGDDVFEYLYLQGWGLWQGLGFAAWADASDNQTGGAALLGMSLGYLVPLISNQLADYTLMDDLLILGGSVWGTWIGGWSAYALGSRGTDLIPAAAILGDIGLVGSALLTLPGVGVSRSTLGWMHVGGASGMGLGTVLLALVTGDGEAIAMGSSAGALLGLAGGAILAAALETSSPKNEAPSSPRDSQVHNEKHRKWTLAGIELPYLMPTSFLVPGPAGHQDDWVTMYGVEGLF